MDNYLGEIRIFAGIYAPAGWVFCNGALLAVSQNEALYALIGTTYGGDGITTFAVPDLRGKVPVAQGEGPGLTPRILGQSFGSESVTLLTNQMPAHSHSLGTVNGPGTNASPQNMVPAQSGTDLVYAPMPGSSPSPQAMKATVVTTAGNSLPHENRMPTTAINYIIATSGIFPSRN